MKWIKASERQPQDWHRVVVAEVYPSGRKALSDFTNESYEYWKQHKNGQEYLSKLVWLDESAFDVEEALSQIMTVDMVAKERGVSPHAVYQMIERGKLSSYKIGSVVVLFRCETVKYLQVIEGLYSTAQVAEKKGCEPYTVLSDRKKGKIKGKRIRKGFWFEKDEVDRYLKTF